MRAVDTDGADRFVIAGKGGKVHRLEQENRPVR